MVDLGPIMLDAERCVLCSRCLRFEREVTGTNLFEFVNRGDHTQIATFENRPITHDYAGNLADVCPVGALLSHDFRFKMRVWFLKAHESICPGCSTGCNVFVDERDGEVQRLRPRRNADVNKSWMCDPGRALYKQIAVTDRVSGARVRGAASWEGVSVAAALDRVASALKEAGAASAFLASPQGTNEDVFAFKALAEAVGGKLDFRVGDPQQQGPRADRPRAAAGRPQPEHAGLPRPGRRPGRRRRDPRRLPRRVGQGRSSSRARRSCACPRPWTRSRRCRSWP